MKTLAILVAAGRGERMGGSRPKAFLSLAGRPMILWVAQAFESAPSVDATVAIVPDVELPAAGEILGGLRKLVAIRAGGLRRQDSVLEGLKEAPDGFDGVVLVHDAARPLVDVDLIEAVIRSADQVGAAVPLLGLTDTVKRVREGRVVETLNREDLAGAQTPQGFRFRLLARAYEQVFRDGVTLTDEAMAVERIGEPVAVVPGSVRNRKLTTPEDLAWAEGVLARERDGARA